MTYEVDVIRRLCSDPSEAILARVAELAARVGELESDRDRLRAALRSLILRIRYTGGYATPEEQDVLREAERAVRG